MKKLLVILSFFLLGFASNAFALDIEKEFKLCVKIKDNIERLDCFDNIVKENAENTVKTSDNWVIHRDKSEFTDKEKIILITNATKPIKNMFNQSVTPTLYLRCEDNKTEAFIDWDIFLGTEKIAVTERIDKEKAEKSNWSLSTDNQAIFNNRPIKFIKKLLNKNILLVQLTPYSESPRTTEFNIQGLENIIEPFQKLCNWK